MGLAGEQAFENEFGIKLDRTSRIDGDGGNDFSLPTIYGLFKVDVKAARKAYNLIVEQGKCFPFTIYVLAKFCDITGIAVLIGWEWGSVIMRTPVRDFGYGVMNHHIAKEKLRGIEELRMVIKFTQSSFDF